jgi:hypothetical protein
MKKLLWIIVFFVLSANFFLYAQTNESDDSSDCKVIKPADKKFFEKGESAINCPQGILYHHKLYGFAATIPALYSQLKRLKMPPEDLGKIASMAFLREEKPPVVLHIILRNNKDGSLKTLDELMPDAIAMACKASYKLEYQPEAITVKGLEARKFVCSVPNFQKIIIYTIKNGNFIYQISLAAPFADSNRYTANLETLLDSITITQ